jgi:hypothetical protein
VLEEEADVRRHGTDESQQDAENEGHEREVFSWIGEPVTGEWCYLRPTRHFGTRAGPLE